MNLNKKILILLTASLLSLSIVGCSSNEGDVSSDQKENNTLQEQEVEEETIEDEIVEENKNPFGNVMEKPVMNGTKTERIGTYAEAMVGGIEITQENLVQFYEEIIKDSDYNWVTLNIDGDTGIVFPGASYYFTYGSIDNEGCITDGKGDGSILDDKVDYTSK